MSFTSDPASLSLVGEIIPMSEAAKERHKLMLGNAVRLAELGQRAINKGFSTKDFVVVCIEVDTRWKSLVDILMPNENRQLIRDTGASPIARGTVMKSICTFLREELPQIKDALMEDPTEGTLKAIVLNDTGGTVYKIRLRPEGSAR